MAALRERVRAMIPKPVLHARRRWRNRRLNDQLNRSDHREAFSVVYRRGAWGRGKDRYFSGLGSHDQELVDPYVEAVRAFLESLPTKPDAIDLGCGDFNVGSRVRPYCAGYVACDVVPQVIEHNRRRYAGAGVDFRCVDMVTEPLPGGDVVFLRAVLQHLSNDHIKQVIPKLYQYQYLVLNDFVPDGSWVPNLDIPTGPEMRAKVDSALDLTAPPFSLEPLEQRELCRVRPRSGYEGEMVTTLYRLR